MPNPIDAAFCSSKVNECYIFVEDKYVIVNYAPGGKKKDIIVSPTDITDGFPMFAETVFQYRIDCSFDTKDNVAFFFAGDQCVKTDYSPHSSSAKARLLQGPMPIIYMFPCLRRTVFEFGIDATMRAHDEKHVYLFKGDDMGVLDFNSNTMVKIQKISHHFQLFVGTVFEWGIDAAYNSHVGNEVYIFKGQYYAHYDVVKRQFLNGIIKRISDEWPALQKLL